MKLDEGHFSSGTVIIQLLDKLYQEINFKRHLNSVLKNITNFSTNPFISGQLSKATAFMVTPKTIVNVLTFCF